MDLEDCRQQHQDSNWIYFSFGLYWCVECKSFRRIRNY